MLSVVDRGDRSSNRAKWRLLVVSRVRLVQTAVAQLLTAELPEAEVLISTSVRSLDRVAQQEDVILIDSSSIDIDNEANLPKSTAKLAILGLSSSDRRAIAGWVAAGATVFIPDTASDTDVVEAIRAAARGDVTCPPSLSEVIIREVPNIAAGLHARRIPKLTQREVEVALLIDQGMSNQAIATKLSISLSTVKNHVHSILKRLGVRGRAEAARITRPN
jgi:two-component system nitrate/nitrite response regulator NarL